MMHRLNVKHVTIVSLNEETCSIVAKINDMEHKILEAKLVLVGNDVVTLKPVNADSQATVEPFPSLYESFGSPYTSAKVDTAGDKSKGTGPGS